MCLAAIFLLSTADKAIKVNIIHSKELSIELFLLTLNHDSELKECFFKVNVSTLMIYDPLLLFFGKIRISHHSKNTAQMAKW